MGLNLQIIKFLLVGGSGFAINISLFYILTKFLYIWYILATVISFSTSIFWSFFIHKRWTFNQPIEKNSALSFEIIKFFFLSFINVSVNTMIIYFLVEKIHLTPTRSAIVSNLFVAIYSFYIYKKIIFKKPI